MASTNSKSLSLTIRVLVFVQSVSATDWVSFFHSVAHTRARSDAQWTEQQRCGGATVDFPVRPVLQRGLFRVGAVAAATADENSNWA